jgi:hypothetical protein
MLYYTIYAHCAKLGGVNVFTQALKHEAAGVKYEAAEHTYYFCSYTST